MADRSRAFRAGGDRRQKNTRSRCRGHHVRKVLAVRRRRGPGATSTCACSTVARALVGFERDRHVGRGGQPGQPDSRRPHRVVQGWGVAGRSRRSSCTPGCSDRPTPATSASPLLLLSHDRCHPRCPSTSPSPGWPLARSISGRWSTEALPGSRTDHRASGLALARRLRFGGHHPVRQGFREGTRRWSSRC